MKSLETIIAENERAAKKEEAAAAKERRTGVMIPREHWIYGRNRAHVFASLECGGVDAALRDYDGGCMNFCDGFSQWLDAQHDKHETLWLGHEDGILRPSTFPDLCWTEHAVIIDDLYIVHDLWFPYPLDLWEYFRAMFPPGVGVSAELR